MFKLLLSLLFLSVTWLPSIGEKTKYFKLVGHTQGTTYSITYYASDSLIHIKELEKLFSEIDYSLSVYQPTSLISQFNNSKRGVIMNHHLKKVVKYSLKVSKITNGDFDITVYPLVEAWGFLQKKRATLPDSLEINMLLNQVGYNKLSIKGDSLIKLNPDTKIDVNGIAQGYTVDVVSDFLEKKGCKNYLVEIGGELRAKGRKPDHSTFKIGVESPAKNRFQDIELKRIITFKKGAITTSGNYRKYVESDGLKRSHLIDTKTGYSITSKNISVTVFSKNAMMADAYDNVLMGMNIDDAFHFLKNKKLDAYFIYENEGVVSDTATVGFKKLFIK